MPITDFVREKVDLFKKIYALLLNYMTKVSIQNEMVSPSVSL